MKEKFQRSKNLQIEIDRLSLMSFGRMASECITKDICVQCEASVLDKETNKYLFRDTLSEQEYSISGMCQKCQDPIFGLGDYEVNDDIPF